MIVARLVFPTTAYGCNLYNQTTIRNETHNILTTDIFSVFKYELRFLTVNSLLEK